MLDTYRNHKTGVCYPYMLWIRIYLKSWAVFIHAWQAGLTEANSGNLDQVYISLSITLFISLQLILVKARNFISFKLVSGLHVAM